MLDYKRFTLEAKERDTLFEIIQAMPEIKIHGIQRDKRWDWEELAVRTARFEAQSLALRQMQRVGVFFLSNLRNILISFLAARAVIQGEMTLGMMLATQYIVGQLNSPIGRLIDFLYTAQDARLSLERMEEIYGHRDEDELAVAASMTTTAIPAGQPLILRGVAFRYPGAGQPDVLRGIDLTIPCGKVTAIVGASGSGKTTLLKLLLGLYPPGRRRDLPRPHPAARARRPRMARALRRRHAGRAHLLRLHRAQYRPRQRSPSTRSGSTPPSASPISATTCATCRTA